MRNIRLLEVLEREQAEHTKGTENAALHARRMEIIKDLVTVSRTNGFHHPLCSILIAFSRLSERLPRESFPDARADMFQLFSHGLVLAELWTEYAKQSAVNAASMEGPLVDDMKRYIEVGITYLCHLFIGSNVENIFANKPPFNGIYDNFEANSESLIMDTHTGIVDARMILLYIKRVLSACDTVHYKPAIDDCYEAAGGAAGEEAPSTSSADPQTAGAAGGAAGEKRKLPEDESSTSKKTKKETWESLRSNGDPVYYTDWSLFLLESVQRFHEPLLKLFEAQVRVPLVTQEFQFEIGYRAKVVHKRMNLLSALMRDVQEIVTGWDIYVLLTSNVTDKVPEMITQHACLITVLSIGALQEIPWQVAMDTVQSCQYEPGRIMQQLTDPGHV
jgi:hypothetical protein